MVLAGDEHGNVGMLRCQSTVDGDPSTAEMTSKTCQVCVRELPMPDHAAPGDLGVANGIRPEAVPRMRGEPVKDLDRVTGVDLAYAQVSPPHAVRYTGATREELLISFAGTGCVALHEIESATQVTILAVRHPLADDDH